MPTNAQELALYISAEAATNVTVSVTNTGYTQTFAIPANSVNASIIIPKSGPNDARTLQDGLQQRGIHIVSTEPVAVYAHVYSTMVSGATMLMPVETYGYAYQSVNYYQDRSESNPPDWYSWFFVIASEDNTRVRITPSDSTKNGWLPGNDYTINLNKGESYHVFGKAVFNDDPLFASKDMTGSKAVSIPGPDGQCHPIALFSGSSGIRLCRGDGGEFMHQQMFPIQAWGTRYLTYHTVNNTSTNILQTNRNYYRVCVTDPATQVRRNGLLLTGLVNNFFYEFMDSTGGDYITADKPILVAQYTTNKNQCWNYPTTSPVPPSYGDPEMFYLSPIEQGQRSVLFYTSRLSAIDYVYVNIYAPASAIGSLRVDGNPLPAAQIINHPALPGYAVALARITGPSAQHRITCDSIFNATVYGLGNYESYGYNVGTAINNLNQYGAFNNVNSSATVTDSVTCKNTPLVLKIKLSLQPDQIIWKRSAVASLVPNTDIIENNPVPSGTETINNRLYYLYSLSQPVSFTTTGNFVVPVLYNSTVNGNCSDTGSVMILIKVKEGPQASFIFNNPVCANSPVLFTGNTQPQDFTLTGYEWLFSDGSTQATVHATKVFTIAQNESVRYRVISAEGCIDDSTQTVTVLPQPRAGFESALQLCASDSLLVTDTSSVTSGSIVTWNWSWPNGGQLSANNAQPFYLHFTAAGNNTVNLQVASAAGCVSDTFVKTINVLSVPLAQFQATLAGCAGNQVQLTNQSQPNGTTIQTWTWTFGNGIQDIRNNGNAFNYTYPLAGNYDIGLTVSASNGCSSSLFTQSIITGSLPVANFTFDGRLCVDSLVHFQSSVPYTGSNQTWHWIFGDGQQAVINNSSEITHSYSSQLSNIRMGHFVTIGGCAADTVWQAPVVISDNPVILSATAPTPVCTGINVSITATANSTITRWLWDTGTAQLVSNPPLNLSFSNPGNQIISVSAENNSGCRSLAQPVSINVIQSPVADAGQDLLIIQGSSTTIPAQAIPAGNLIYQWSPADYLSNPVVLQPVTNTPVTQSYQLYVEDRNTGCNDTDAVLVKVMSDIFVPNSFSPDGNGINDVWHIPALEAYPNSMVYVYNRFGQKIFESKGAEAAWNGRWKGADQPAGVYIYKIYTGRVKDKIMSGSLLLIR